MKEKGFTYIIIVIFIMIFTTMLFLLSKNINFQENKAQKIINNYKNEIKYLVENELSEESLDLLNSSFVDYIKSNNYSSKICVVVYDGEENYYLSNYLKEDYDIIEDNNTITLSEDDVFEDISFGECFFEILRAENLKYYIEIYNNKEKMVHTQ